MGILDFFKKRKPEEVAETKGEQINEDGAVQPTADSEESLIKPATENKFKSPAVSEAISESEVNFLEDDLSEEKEDDRVEDVLASTGDIDSATSRATADDATEDERPIADQEIAAATVAESREDAVTNDTTASQEGAYLGNLAHTAVIDQLLRVPRSERDDDWIGNFLTHVPTASFVCGEPQVIQGPDNFPYFQIFIPEANKPFQCYVLEHMLDDFLLDNGLGVALEPKGGEVEWVLSYGDLLHYSVHRTFAIPQDHVFGKGSEGEEVVKADEEVLVGAPSESILPTRARSVIREFLIAQGIKDPKVCLIDRSAYGKGQDLVFNLTPWQFENEAHYQAIMRALGWFLPRYYSYLGTEEAAFKEHFLAL